MMYNVEIYINRELIDQPENGVSIRINNELWNPTKTVTTTSTYSFTFTIPATKQNNKVLGFANVLSVPAKFKRRYDCKVYGDGHLLFDGSLKIKSFNAESQEYSCNLVNIKQPTVPDIFGDKKLTDIDWYVDYSGATTINSVNADETKKYFFPLVSYGAFQKEPLFSDDVASEYTSKFLIDKYTKFWNESFYPSLNMLEVMRLAFEQEGYVVGGSAFGDEVLNDIYLSTNLADDQSPHFNLGNPLFGKVDITMGFNTYTNYDETVQTLKFPIQGINSSYSNYPLPTQFDYYNFQDIDVFNLAQTVIINDKTYIYELDGKATVIPADGWYKIHLTGNAQLLKTVSAFTTEQYGILDGWEIGGKGMTFEKTPDYSAPFEIQLVRNYSQDIELIKGKKNIRYQSGDMNTETIIFNAGPSYPNKFEWQTCYPHEKLTNVANPTDTQVLGIGSGDTYMYADGYPMAYDSGVNPNFILGVTSLGGCTTAIIKNGRSWSPVTTDENSVIANIRGYNKYVRNGSRTSVVPSSLNQNTFNGSPVPSAYIDSNNNMTFTVDAMVYLKKNDRLELFGVQKHYDVYSESDATKDHYGWSGQCNMTIIAMSDASRESLLRRGIGYGSSTEFSDKLRLTDFLNEETTIQQFLSDACTAFQLEINQNGMTVDINLLNQPQADGIKAYAVDIDEQVGSEKFESEEIEFAKSMAVKFKIDTEEYGFESSVPENRINDDDWKEYGDSGYSVINLEDDDYVTEEEDTQTNFSYCWYEPFTLNIFSGYGEETGDSTFIELPVIEKAEYMADGYGYEEAMAHDGYSLTQRFWYRGNRSSNVIYLADHNHEMVYITTPIGYKNNTDLSYKVGNGTLLSRFFNVNPLLASNYVTVNLYLSPLQYDAIRNGAMVKYDSSLYIVASMTGYDPSGRNRTALKLVKK